MLRPRTKQKRLATEPGPLQLSSQTDCAMRKATWCSIWAGRKGKQKSLRPKSARRVSEKLPGKLNSSLAVFYVEQVALNRHVFAATAADSFMPEQRTGVKSNIYEGKDKGPPRLL